MLKLLFATAIAIQVVAFSSDASELALWLPGLVIGTVGLFLGDRRHFFVNDLFFILFLILFVAAPADQLDGRRFLGDLSVRGIVFPEHVLLRSVVLSDLFALCVVAIKLLDWMSIPGQPLHNKKAVGKAKLSLPKPKEISVVSEVASTDLDANSDIVVVEEPSDSTLGIRPVPIGKRRIIAPFETRAAHLSRWKGQFSTVHLLMAFVSIEFLMLGFMVFAQGGASFIYDGRDYLSSLQEKNQALATITQGFLQVIPLVGLIVGVINWQKSHSAQSILWLVVMFIGCLVFNNPFNTARFQFGAFCLMVMLFVFRGRIRSHVCYLGLVTFLMIIMPFMNVIRNGGLQRITDLSDGVSVKLDFKQLDFDAFSMFACAVYKTGDSGFTGGTYLTSVLFFFIPRGLWPDKPQASSLDLGQFLVMHHSGWFDNLSCPPFGDFYMDFGTFGVLCCGLIYGVILRWSDTILRTWEQSPFFACGVAAAVMGYLPILVRGSLGAVVGGFVITSVILLGTSRLLPKAPTIST
jgi:oligosaccharide repeat unit polymerase